MKKDEITVVFSSDDNYAKYLGVSICSLIKSSTKKNNYNIIILDGGISDFNKDALSKMATDNVNINFYDMSPVVEEYKKRLFVSGHISMAAYYRLFIADVLKNYEKIIYTDCDVTFVCDIANLWNEKIRKDDLIAAVPDIGLIYSMDNGKQNNEYFLKCIGVEKIEEYFNSGVLIMNLENMRKCDFVNKCIEKLKELKTPVFHDQDILNAVCVGRVTFLPFKYNYWGNFKYENPKYKELFPKQYLEFFEIASKDPAIIHYKPWIVPKLEKAYIFWECARETPFYEEILYTNIFDIKYIMRFSHLKRKIWLYNLLYTVTHNIKFKNKQSRAIAELWRRK